MATAQHPRVSRPVLTRCAARVGRSHAQLLLHICLAALAGMSFGCDHGEDIERLRGQRDNAPTSGAGDANDIGGGGGTLPTVDSADGRIPEGDDGANLDGGAMDDTESADAAVDACVPTPEQCNGLDDDCDGVDDRDDEDTTALCATMVLNAQVQCLDSFGGFRCTALRCLDGYGNCDGQPADGCEPLDEEGVCCPDGVCDDDDAGVL